MGSPVRKRNARGSGALLRAEILTAACELLDAADRESDLTLRGIACAAGISAPAIYAHFEHRDAILSAIAEQSWQQVVADIRAEAPA
ncbi:TetR family transcriptional regulator [Mycobacterium sp. AMU20-3851]|uniref:TetR/AcrR family transcriptional regulator n=1 Tax=Mycobacterium sp. AMU20-3851 TaxID=3122055 RepID=UPI00375507CA